MVLPFEPMTMTFKDLHYWVQIPKVCLVLTPISLAVSLHITLPKNKEPSL